MTPDKFYGWLDRPADVAAFVARLPLPTFNVAAPALMGTEHRDVLFWEQGELALFNQLLPAHAQDIGDCFAAGALVELANGSHVPIESVPVGATVVTHMGNHRRVVDTIKKKFSGQMMRVRSLDAGAGSVWCTPDHRFPVRGLDEEWSWFSASDIEAGRKGPLFVDNLHNVTDFDVYCLTVEGDHSFIANGLRAANCVSHGYARGIQDAMFIDQAQSRDPENPKPPQGMLFDGHRWTYRGKPVGGDDKIIEIATEPIYALSRVEVGKGQIGSGDGSVGAWAAEAANEYGCLARGKYGNVDLSRYDARIAKAWGMPRAGLPNDLEPEAKLHICKYVTLIENGDQARAALYNLYPIPVCSMQGFTMVRDSRGMCKPQGSWAHCMVVRGIAMLKGGILVVIIQQSWGENPTGNDIITLEKDGRQVKLPQGCFAVDFEVFERKMISAKDSFALSGPLGFKARRPLAWNVFDQAA